MRTRFLDPERLHLFGQLFRYGITGLIVTALNIAVYHVALDWLKVSPNVAWTFGFIAAFVAAYPLHSRYSFRDHGTRDNLLRSAIRFFVVSLGGFALNSFWVWSMVVQLRLPAWTPDIPVLFVTPLVAFSVNRKWVFE